MKLIEQQLHNRNATRQAPFIQTRLARQHVALEFGPEEDFRRYAARKIRLWKHDGIDPLAHRGSHA